LGKRNFGGGKDVSMVWRERIWPPGRAEEGSQNVDWKNVEHEGDPKRFFSNWENGGGGYPRVSADGGRRAGKKWTKKQELTQVRDSNGSPRDRAEGNNRGKGNIIKGWPQGEREKMSSFKEKYQYGGKIICAEQKKDRHRRERKQPEGGTGDQRGEK